jgi:hypothetical protein
MLQAQGMPAQQANLYPNPAQPQQFQPSPNVQNAQMPLPMNNVQPQINQPNSNPAQQLEAFFRSHPEMEKSERAQAINQIMMRAKQAGTSINMGSLSQNPQQPQAQPQQQQQRPHPVGLNGFTPQPQVQQNQNMGQQAGQRMSNQPIQHPAQAQQAMQYPGAGDTQRQIEAVCASLPTITDSQLQAMKQRQRSGLVTPQQNNGNALPLPSPQPGQSMQQQQQLPGGITPSHHNRTLSHSSSVHPPIPQPPQQQPQQQQQQQQSQQSQQQGQAAGIFTMVQGWDNDHLEKATASMLSKVAGTSNVSFAPIRRISANLSSSTKRSRAGLH